MKLVMFFHVVFSDLLCRHQRAELCIRKGLSITYVLKCLLPPTFSICIPVRHMLRKEKALVQPLSLRLSKLSIFISSLRKIFYPPG